MKNLLIIGLIFLISCQKKNNQKLSPEHQKALKSLEVMDGFKVEMVAAEPLISDPVAMEIDENGNMYVVEMHGYPLDLSRTGKIKLLKDTNDDGLPDTSIVFADSLKLPNGIQRWKNGFIVTDTPDVLYLEDTNNDGKADIRKVMLTGFALSNPQHNLNTPRFELDNWIYLGHEGEVTPFVFKKEFGDKGSEIVFPDNKKATKLETNANGRAVRFKPDTYEIEELSGETQFGHTTDAWGNRFYTSNANHLFHEVLQSKYIKNNPNLLIPDATQNIPDHGDAAEIFPITENPNHQLLTDVGVITSSCGVTWYLGGAFGEKFKKVTFIAEPVHNLVHADIIEDNGASFTAKRLLEKKEFLASKDDWFRPVNFYIGPDGALYVIDYYRQIVEHPEWMSNEINKSGALYNGTDKGRIYRITPEKGLDMNWLGKLNLSKKTDEELVELLDNENIWFRRTAQRLLLHRNAKSTIPLLKKLLAEAKNSEAKVHALWLLDSMKEIDNQTITLTLKDDYAGVRINGIKMFEKYINTEKGVDISVFDYFKTLKNDPHPKVRFQMLNSMGNNHSFSYLKNNILFHDIEDKWVGIAAIAASKDSEIDLFELATKELKNKNIPQTQNFFAYLGATIANSGKKEDFDKIFKQINSVNKGSIQENEWWKAATLSGIAKLWKYKGETITFDEKNKIGLLMNISSTFSTELRQASLELLSVVGLPKNNFTTAKIKEASQIALDSQQKEDLRADMIRLLALQNSKALSKILEALLAKNEPEIIQKTVLSTIRKVAVNQTCNFVLKQFNQYSPTVKDEAIGLLMEKPERIHLLLNAIDEKKIDKSVIGWGKMVRMMNYYDTEVRTHARKVLSLNEDRKAVLQQYMKVLEMKGNKENGKEVFEQNCATCHQIEGVKGVNFGPNLSTLRSRNPLSILTEIINPNNSIADRFDYWNLTFKNGNIISGIIAQENANTLTIREINGKETVVEQKNISSKQKSETSIMPNGLENAINKQQMADLIAFIKKR